LLLHLAWRRNLDSFDLALAANRVAARGAALWWLGAPGPTHEPGDYLCEVDEPTAARIRDFGIVAERWNRGLPDGAVALAHPRIALFAGAAASYPNFAYYAMALARLGFDFDLVDGAALADNALRHYDLVVLPGGSAVWGLDAAEGVIGADAALRDFLGGRGAAIGSGAGAFYLSAGRPGWTAIAPVRPVYTQEFLRTGVGLVSVRFDADSVVFGCPPTLEMPYYHGPVFAELDRSTSAAAHFDRLLLPGELFVANPLDPGFFNREMAGHAAILRAETRRGRAVLFSPNPEMGDLVRKYFAFDRYIARYLPVRGEEVMADTLRHYRPLDAPSWRPILNAVHSLMLRQAPPGVAPTAPVPPQPAAPEVRLPQVIAEATERLPLADDAPLGGLAAMLSDDLRERLSSVEKRLDIVETAFAELDPPAPAIRYLWASCETAALAAFSEPDESRPLAEQLARIETAIALAEAWCCLAEAERHFARTNGV
jgi:hypothetical protein